MTRRWFLTLTASLMAAFGLRIERKPQPVFTIEFEDRDGRVQNIDFWEWHSYIGGWQLAKGELGDIFGVAQYRPAGNGVEIDWYTIAQPRTAGEAMSLANLDTAHRVYRNFHCPTL